MKKDEWSVKNDIYFNIYDIHDRKAGKIKGKAMKRKNIDVTGALLTYRLEGLVFDRTNKLLSSK